MARLAALLGAAALLCGPVETADAQSFFQRIFGGGKKKAEPAKTTTGPGMSTSTAGPTGPITPIAPTSGNALYRTTVSATPLAAAGSTFEIKIGVTALNNIANVQVSDKIPEGTVLVGTEPAAKVDGRNLSWSFPQLKNGDSRNLTIKLKATAEGDYQSCASVTAVPMACVTTRIGKPRLELTKTGPSSAVINQPITYNVTVINNGNMVAQNVVVTDTIPAGLRHATGQSTYTWNIGNLAPKQRETRAIVLTGTKGGDFCNKALAKSSNAGQAEAEACTKILVPGLNVDKSGPPLQFLGKRATYTIKVTNAGQTTLNDVVVVDSAPAATQILSTSPTATVVGNRAEWRLPSLAPKAEKSFQVVLTTMTAGTHPNAVAVTTREGLQGSDTVPTVWKGISALLITVADDPDPILVNETTTYTITVRNQGTHDDTNIKLDGLFGEEITPVSASNGGSIDGKKVSFPAVPRLAPKESFQFTIKAKGVKAGDHRLKVTRTSTDIPKPTTAEESTRVY